MPYLAPAERERLERGALPETAGQVNYLVTCIVLAFLGERPDYARFNAAIGALECAKQELYAKAVRPYEEQKAIQNGPIPWPQH